MLWILVYSLLIVGTALGAGNCVEKNNAPPCPDTGSTILDETYPTQTFVISTRGIQSSDSAEKLPAEFITSILTSYPGTDLPDIVVPTSVYAYDLLIKEVEQKLLKVNSNPDFVKKQLSSIKLVINRPYTWQQDYFESFISPSTGRPVVREVESYANKFELAKQTLDGLISTSANCPVEKGEPLKSFKGENLKSNSWGAGEMGGNIEGLPGGLCLKGNNQAEGYVAQYCGNKEQNNSVEIDVGWLEVGHADEVIKVVPTFPKKSPDACNFSILLASPRRGLEVLKNNEYSNKAFIDLSDLDSEGRAEKLDDISKSKAGVQLCRTLKKFKLPRSEKSAPSSGSEARVKSAFINFFKKNFMIGVAHAGGSVNASDNCAQKLEIITYYEIVKMMEKDTDFITFNNLVQEKMDQNKKVMEARLKERLPQCKDIKFIDMPDLFFGLTAEIGGKKVLAQPGNGRSIFPNPTNSVLANQTMIVPQTPNFAFNRAVTETLNKQGLKTSFIDTWDYAHVGDGNMHCSSHSLPYCKPRIK